MCRGRYLICCVPGWRQTTRMVMLTSLYLMLRHHTGRHSLSLHKSPHSGAIAGILVSLVAQPNTISLTSVQLVILLHLMPTPENAQQFQRLEFRIRFFRKFLNRIFPLCLTLSVCLRGIKMSVENTYVPWRPLCTVKG